MAIIKPSRNFAGSEIDSGAFSNYFKPDIRRARFSVKNDNKDGAHLYFLPPYKADHTGSGVWYRVINVRRNFGPSNSQYFIPNLDTDPAAHFEKNFKRFFPEEAKQKTTLTESGKTRKVYPPYGRVARRVLYNVLFANNVAGKGHVLDLPSYNGADTIDKYHSSKNVDGSERALICDPERCAAVFVQMTDSANPWKIIPDPSQVVALPPEYQDAALGYFYNLDEVTEGREAEAIIADLRNFFPSDIFDACMQGYHGFASSAPVQGFSTAPSRVNPVMAPAIAPAITPTVTPALAGFSSPAVAPAPTLPSTVVSAIPKTLSAPALSTSAPAGPTAGVSVEEAMKMLKKA